MQCRDTAHAIGLLDRGTLEVGMKADINIIDWDAVKINMPYYTYDLPAGAPRWMQTVSGAYEGAHFLSFSIIKSSFSLKNRHFCMK